MKILFQGDSVTDSGGHRSGPHDMGEGYPKYASAMLMDCYPELPFDFFNLGVSGNRSADLLCRMEKDLIEIQPDLVSVLIGINDVWHRHYANPVLTTDAEFENNYRVLLENIRSRTNAKILMIEPFLLYAPEKESWRGELDSIVTVTRTLADQYADAYLPLNSLFADALSQAPKPDFYSADGVHPNADGACFIGEQYLRTVSPLIDVWEETEKS